MKPKLPPDPGIHPRDLGRPTGRYDFDGADVEAMLRVHDYMREMANKRDPEIARRERAVRASDAYRRLDLADLDPELQVELFNKLVELMGSR